MRRNVLRTAPLSAAAAAALFSLWPGAAAEARIKLITLPPRERVEVQLDNPDATLVEEERIVPLVKGENQVDFSWANTQIDPQSIVFRVIAPGAGGGDTKPDARPDVKVLSVSYPPNEAALVWSVAASDSGSARVRISYVLGNLTKSFNYRAVASHDEKTLTLAQYMRIQNLANEEFGHTDIWAGFGKEFLKPIGLNETKEVLMARTPGVPVRKTYTASVSEFGYLDQPQNKLRVPMHYVVKNDKDDKLGAAPLPEGKVRIFIEGTEAQKATTFLGEDWGRFTPADDEMRLHLGVAQDIVVRRTIDRNERQRIAGNLFNQVVVVKYEIENFKDQPVTLDLVENLRQVRGEVGIGNDRDVEWEPGKETTLGAPDPEKSTFEKVLFHVKLPTRAADGKAEKVVHKFAVVLKNEW